jgi:hypothetical protein
MKLMLIWCVLLMSTNQALADCQQTLDLCLGAETKCKAAIGQKNQEIQLCRLAVSKGVEQNSQLNQTIESQDAKLSAWYRNPFLLLAIGLVAGVALTR